MLLYRFSSDFETKKEQIRLSIIDNITAILSSYPPSWNVELTSPLLMKSIVNFGFINPHRQSTNQETDKLSIVLMRLLNVFEPRLKEVNIDATFNDEESYRLDFTLEGYYIYEGEYIDIALNSKANVVNDGFNLKESYFVS